MGYRTYHDSYNTSSIASTDTIPVKVSPILCLCGSLKYWDELIQANAMLVTKNIISIPSGFSMKYPEKFPVVKDYVLRNPDKMKKIFDELHYQKIMIADGIWVLNVNDYIGDSTKREILFAQSIGKKIFTIQPCSFCSQSGIDYQVVPLDCLAEFPKDLYLKGSIPTEYVKAYEKFVSHIDGK